MNAMQQTMCETFLGWDTRTQMDVLHKEGVYIGKLKEGGVYRMLYQYQAIYVEVVYASYRKIVETVNCFTEPDVLDRYLASENFDRSALE